MPLPLPATAAYRREESNQFDFTFRHLAAVFKINYTPNGNLFRIIVREQSIDRIHIKFIN